LAEPVGKPSEPIGIWLNWLENQANRSESGQTSQAEPIKSTSISDDQRQLATEDDMALTHDDMDDDVITR